MGDEDKQFEASHQKLDRARKEGQVVKSKDFSTAISLLVMFISINAMGPFIWEQISALYIKLYEQIPNTHLDSIGIAYIMSSTFIPAVLIILPILLLAAFVAIVADYIQVGPLFTVTPLMPKLDKLNPTKYFKNIMSMKTVFDLLKNIAKVIVLGFIGYVVYMAHFPEILALATVSNQFATLVAFGKLVLDFVMMAGIAFLVIATGDYAFTKWKFMQDQKMSFKEVKDEHKISEGDPHVKAALRQKRMQLLQKGMMDSVPDADFIVTNPIHVACALKYDPDSMESPRLLAKGTELFAKKIKDIAVQHGIPVIENAPVARAIYRMVEINHDIPPDLYKAVAEILIFVYNLKKSSGAQNPVNKAIERTKDIKKNDNQN